MQANKMKYNMTRERWGTIKQFLDYAIENPDNVPERGRVLALSDTEISRVFTKRKIELITTIKKEDPGSVSELSEKLDRKISAVERDLRDLEGFGIVKLEKRGRVLKPEVRWDVLILPITIPKRLEELIA